MSVSTRAWGEDIRFTGKVARVDLACAADRGMCRILVDDRWVYWGLPGKVPPGYEKENGGQGKLLDAKGKQIPIQRLPGKTVEVFARKDGKHATLWGNPGYYLRVIAKP